MQPIHVHLHCVFYTIQNPDCIGPPHVNITCVFTCTQTSMFASLYMYVCSILSNTMKQIALVAPFDIRYCGTVPNFNVLSGGTPAQNTCTLIQYMCSFNGSLQICPTQLKNQNKQTHKRTHKQKNKQTNKQTNKLTN